MKHLTRLATAATLMTTLATFAHAGGHANWTAVPDQSSLAFGSIKKDTVGEVHHFEDVTGTVSEAGALAISINLGSVETYIDVRNERMIEHVFKAADARATLAGDVDMEALNALEVGETTLTDFEGVLSLGGREAEVEAEILVARLTEDRVLVTTASMIMLSTADLGMDQGIDTLMKLAKLPGITRVTPITVRMVFEK
ncbi:YceI family protein [Tropicibacter sp. Alg240-R139]|uniref:YceI family protein n=1 Tax=Tropicibacter sp. Alg240-R139 TaxID=2305991 RepID=UPI001F087EE3|nr:YceI family protein [Tropicibacter sp. Alg240-R139]